MKVTQGFFFLFRIILLCPRMMGMGPDTIHAAGTVRISPELVFSPSGARWHAVTASRHHGIARRSDTRITFRFTLVSVLGDLILIWEDTGFSKFSIRNGRKDESAGQLRGPPVGYIVNRYGWIQLVDIIICSLFDYNHEY